MKSFAAQLVAIGGSSGQVRTLALEWTSIRGVVPDVYPCCEGKPNGDLFFTGRQSEPSSFLVFILSKAATRIAQTGRKKVKKQFESQSPVPACTICKLPAAFVASVHGAARCVRMIEGFGHSHHTGGQNAAPVGGWFTPRFHPAPVDGLCCSKIGFHPSQLRNGVYPSTAVLLWGRGTGLIR